jgi:2,4-dienoyl-CoA reductase-like NADH-dependent reductase (Old Yellow Enzyme family)
MNEQEILALSAQPYAAAVSILSQEKVVAGKTVPNRFVYQPMEACDCELDGTPTDLTLRKYLRFAEGGAGMIWMEAAPVTVEGKASPRQLMLTEKNIDAFAKMNDAIREAAVKSGNKVPIIIFQATHSGRQSKPNPVTVCSKATLEAVRPLSSEYIITDEEAARLPEAFYQTAKLMKKAGYDGYDMKSCHGYLMAEFASAYNREGLYGGAEFEKRWRLYLDCLKASKEGLTDEILTARLGVYDGYADGWATNPDLTPDLTEPKRLISIMAKDYGVKLLNITLGNPYYFPHLNRPHRGKNLPESPVQGVKRFADITGELQRSQPDVDFVLSGLSYLGSAGADYAAKQIEAGVAAFAGFGRMTLAYPDLASDFMKTGKLNEKKCCITCSKCTELMRAGSISGCPIRDPLYTDIYRRDVLHKNV